MEESRRKGLIFWVVSDENFTRLNFQLLKKQKKTKKNMYTTSAMVRQK